MPRNDHRRAALADAGIRVLAQEGARGLTHRAVDRAAGLPVGTASNYFPRRDDLVAALVERIGEPLGLDGLDQIIDRLRLECADRMVRIGGDEDDERGLDFHQSLDHRKTVESGHLDIKEDEVGLVRLDLTNGLPAVLRGVDDFDIAMRFKPQLQALGRQFLVIHQDGSDRHVRSVPIVACPSG